MNAIDTARAALEAWDDPDHDAWYDRNLIDPPHMVVNALRDLMAEYERVTTVTAAMVDAAAHAIAKDDDAFGDTYSIDDYRNMARAALEAAEAAR